MRTKYEMMGDLAAPLSAEIDEALSPVEIASGLGLRMRGGGRMIGAQIGGVLGPIAFGAELAQPLAARLDELSTKQILFIGEPFCPVDYLRFLSRFLVREIRVDTPATRALNDWIEAMTQGRSSEAELAGMEEVLGGLGNSVAEIRVAGLYRRIVARFEDDFVDHAKRSTCRTGICRTLIAAQCVNACPAKVHIPGYVALMKAGDNAQAYALMRKTNPLSLVCGKICARPCEARCRRGEIESTVGVRALQRYASAAALGGPGWKEDRLTPNGKSVGIVGAGPAGLTAAYYLQRAGYRALVYEERDVAGGMLRYCVPEFRMPAADLDLEIGTILDLGVDIRYGCKVGRDVSLEDLAARHHAVIVAAGAQRGLSLDALASPRTETAVDFLRAVRLGGRSSAGRRVVVLGGGDVAMDAARTAVRLGAAEVSVVSLEEYDAMPANREDKELCGREGVRFVGGYGISACADRGSAGLSLALTRCLAVVDLEGRFAPVISKTETKELEADSLILAVGQAPELDFAPSLARRRGNFVAADPDTGLTSMPGVYAIGDVVKNGIAIGAIADARRIAVSVDAALGGRGLYVGADIPLPEEKLSITTWDDGPRAEPSRRTDKLAGDFAETTRTYSEDDARREASRCMRCDRNSIQPLWLRPLA